MSHSILIILLKLKASSDNTVRIFYLQMLTREYTRWESIYCHKKKNIYVQRVRQGSKKIAEVAV